MAPSAVFVAKHGQVDPGPGWLDPNGAKPVEYEQHAVNVDLDRREREDLAEFTGFTDRTVIETVVDGRCFVSSSGVPAIA